MAFISLVRTDNQIYGEIPEAVFEDLKLDQLFSKNVLGVMAKLPVKGDILLRQQLFCALEQKETLLQLSSLLDELKELKLVFEAYGAASTQNEKLYIFAALLYRVTVFYAHAAVNAAECSFLTAFSDHFAQRCNEPDFKDMAEQAQRVYDDILRSFDLLIARDKITLTKECKEGYTQRLEKCALEMGIPLKKGEVMSRRVCASFTDSLALIYPGLWSDFKQLYESWSEYPDPEVLGYIDELDYYISVHRVISNARAKAVPICYAQISASPEINIASAYDISLFTKECEEIVPNDIYFDAASPFFFLSGANGGGKTTYLRTCGISVVLSLGGCPVPAVSARLCMLDSVLTHFPRDERFEFEGRFLDEQNRVDALISKMGKKSLILLNETYSTTNEKKAVEMTLSLAQRLYGEKQFGVYVTHQKNVLEGEIPLLACVIDTNDENKRTYKIKRIHSIGSSYAEDVLKKYGLSRRDLEERFGDIG